MLIPLSVELKINLRSKKLLISGSYNPHLNSIQNYMNFTNEHFRRDLLRELSFQNIEPNEFDEFKFIDSKQLNPHAPLKEKYIRCNPAV